MAVSLIVLTELEELKKQNKKNLSWNLLIMNILGFSDYIGTVKKIIHCVH